MCGAVWMHRRIWGKAHICFTSLDTLDISDQATTSTLENTQHQLPARLSQLKPETGFHSSSSSLVPVAGVPSPLKQWSASPTTCGSAERSGSAAAAAAWGAAAAGAAGPCGASQSGPPSPPALWECSEPPASRCPWPPSAAPPLSRGARLPHSAGGLRKSERAEFFKGSWLEYILKNSNSS